MQTIIDPEIKLRLDLNTQIEPVIYARIFLDVLAEHGVRASEVLEGTGLSPVDLADPKNLMTIAQQIRIYTNIEQLSTHPAIGLLQGQQIKPHHHGVWGYAMQTAASHTSVRAFLTVLSIFLSDFFICTCPNA